MPATNSKRDALIAEGLNEAEADYLVSGGTKTDGLNLPGDGTTAITAEPVRDIEENPEPQTPAAQQEDADSPPPPKDSPYYPQWQREKRRRQELQATLKEREDKLAAITTDLSGEREKWARLDERMRVFREAAEASDPNAAPPQPKQKPDREADPFGYMAYQDEQLEELRSSLNQFTIRTQERDAAVELTSTFRNDAAQFTRTNPDFWESAPNAGDGAYHFLMRSRDAELQAAGYSDPQERMRIIAADERDIVARSLATKQRNPSAAGPAEVLFNLATARGYQKRAPPAAAAANGAANGAARPAPAAAAAPRAPSVTEQVNAIKEGQAASRSLSSAGGAPPPQGIDLANIANMNDGEYSQWVRTLTPAQRREYTQLIGYMGR